MKRSRFVVVALAACVLAMPSVAKTVQDPFGTRVVSFRTEQVDSMNSALGAARFEQAPWTEDAVMIAMQLVPGVREGALERRLLLVAFEGDTAVPRSGTVTIREDALADDSVEAMWHQLALARPSGGHWRITGYRVAQRCGRGDNRVDFRAELCP